jgi:hypothetical protein
MRYADDGEEYEITLAEDELRTVTIEDGAGSVLGSRDSDGDISLTVAVPAAGTYYIRIAVRATHDDSSYTLGVTADE